MQTLIFYDCHLQDLVKAVDVAIKVKDLAASNLVEVYVKGTFKDANGELVFLNNGWFKIVDISTISRRNKYFLVVVDTLQTQLTPYENIKVY